MDKLHDIRGKRIILGLSGGVDSAVAALLLKQRGADVHALHMTNWEDDDGYCTAAADLQDSRQVCDQLQIPLHHVNFAREYRDRVFKYFLEEYRVGRTPNPDVLCNREIKFGVFRDYAKRLGGDLLATGHYARVLHRDGRVELRKARDGNKDQSYFLHAVSAEALADTVFPLAELVKDEVRDLARHHGLKNFAKKDSTGICFIGERPFREFLSTFLPASTGPIETPDGEIIGEHHGLIYYTVGQRQGLGVGGLRNAGDAPWYVAAKNLQENVLIVVQGQHPMLFSNEMETAPADWIGPAPLPLAAGERFACKVKIRYRQTDQACTVSQQAGGRLSVVFQKRQRAIAPGQFAVFYAGDRCLGGAIIDHACSRPTALQAAI